MNIQQKTVGLGDMIKMNKTTTRNKIQNQQIKEPTKLQQLLVFYHMLQF